MILIMPPEFNLLYQLAIMKSTFESKDILWIISQLKHKHWTFTCPIGSNIIVIITNIVFINSCVIFYSK